MRILVTGGAGFIGSSFVRYVLHHYPGDSVVNFHKLTCAGNLENLVDVADHRRYSFVLAQRSRINTRTVWGWGRVTRT